MKTRNVILGQALILGAFLAVPVSGVFASEGQGMMGMGRGGEPPTVASCVEKTGKTEAECQSMMTSFGNRKPGEEQGNPAASEKRGSEVMKSDDNRTIRREARATDRFKVIETRISKVVVYLAVKGVSTTELESAVSTLKEKMAVAETAGANFETARIAWKVDKTDASKASLENTRTAYKESVAAVKVYYQGTVLPLVKTLLQSVTE